MCKPHRKSIIIYFVLVKLILRQYRPKMMETRDDRHNYIYHYDHHQTDIVGGGGTPQYFISMSHCLLCGTSFNS